MGGRNEEKMPEEALRDHFDFVPLLKFLNPLLCVQQVGAIKRKSFSELIDGFDLGGVLTLRGENIYVFFGGGGEGSLSNSYIVSPIFMPPGMNIMQHHDTIHSTLFSI